jgi:hypothetical protein
MLWAIADDYRAEARAMKEESLVFLHENLCAATLKRLLVDCQTIINHRGHRGFAEDVETPSFPPLPLSQLQYDSQMEAIEERQC